MKIQLMAEQRRVLGVLIEKSLATAEHYPMTLSAIVAACNQKNNRDPVVNYGESNVGRVLYELMQMNLVAQADSAPGARANRFAHRVHEELDWNRRHRAVMAELLLRGGQTVGELRTHSARMVPLPDVAAVISVLEELGNLDPPRVRVLPRQPGQAAIRYDHTLYPPEELAASAPALPTAAPAGPVEAVTASDLAARVDRLEAEVASLRAEVEDLRRSLTS
ncbi:MAG: DUF480 domain-containing protein [Planctomycetota bacterium]